MKTIKLGGLGASNHFIKRIVLPATALESVDIVAIASRSAAKAEQVSKQFNIPKYYQSYEALLNDEELDAVYIPLPNHLHAEWIKKAALKGKHILCEKPMCMTSQELIEVKEVCDKNNVILMEAYMYKYHPQWIKVRDIIRTNNIGNIKYINTLFSYNNPSPSNIRNIKEYGGGGLRDIGCYAISVPRFLLDREPVRVISTMNYHKEFGTDDLTSAILDFESAQATFTVSTSTAAFQRVEIIATAGRITIHLPFNTYTDVPAKITVDTAISSRDILIDPVDQYGLMIDAFAAMVNKGEESDDDDLHNQKVLDAIERSSLSQSWEAIS
ncbi:Gfo/Idh/MocA family protein [Carboxylicivirga sp. M1479]|uniref:Gfo/Idh/MocA family protein n=1 Tax=Carboxylicivirga sp. M1479 TaxID=2594476 RepID=UPI0011776879|nr:Gfo/Idh/MocA family oxidoreductase [Carboxylicivirga sp. M1479]TRX71216.1 Gfo/Idh/MocA family oxidoreductase [Carboxylicivirga sp. M1479]